MMIRNQQNQRSFLLFWLSFFSFLDESLAWAAFLLELPLFRLAEPLAELDWATVKIGERIGDFSFWTETKLEAGLFWVPTAREGILLVEGTDTWTFFGSNKSFLFPLERFLMWVGLVFLPQLGCFVEAFLGIMISSFDSAHSSIWSYSYRESPSWR